MHNVFYKAFGSIFTGFYGLGKTLGIPFTLAAKATGNAKVRQMSRSAYRSPSVKYNKSRMMRYGRN
jgi:hypothetical protein